MQAEGRMKNLKLSRVVKARQDGNIALVGDGINDARVPARADVGVAMGALGNDAAVEAADVVLMNDSPMKMAEAVSIAKQPAGLSGRISFWPLASKAFLYYSALWEWPRCGNPSSQTWARL